MVKSTHFYAGIFLQILLVAVRPDVASAFAAGGGFAKSIAPVAEHVPESASDLIDFLKAQGSKGIGSGVEVGRSIDSTIRGLYATKDFKKDQILCRIPSDCALALSDPSEAGDGGSISAALGGLNFLKFYVKNPQAAMLWAPYLGSLPTQGSSDFDATPDFFSEEEVRELEFPRLINSVAGRLAEIRELAGEAQISVDDLHFAAWLVSSRSYRIAIDAGDDVDLDDGVRSTVSKPKRYLRVMLPFIDLANHSSDGANCEMHIVDPEKDDAWFTIRALRPIRAGKEIKLCYGTGVESSVELLANYGFVQTDNKIDPLMLKKGGDDCITSIGGWKTTLEGDEALLATGDLSDNMKKVLEFRCRLKRS
eukprot:CAMPEP_0194279568 /NCGR_PEP_ID=MMETSP0169-20130528/14005_1 /TAXON_ID=218684 /ORGANISM="Corethron pennatum, Strain L29A3" /LENGTH=364 /DNA_ID=CAMNT_0039024013 /DNA_START=65 /DNA_END=1155 /DNA_ORIENTATION=-